jgi:hypothetical protein
LPCGFMLGKIWEGIEVTQGSNEQGSY